MSSLEDNDDSSTRQQPQPMSDNELTDYCRRFIRSPNSDALVVNEFTTVLASAKATIDSRSKNQNCFSMEDAKKLHETGLVDDRVCLEADDETRRQVLGGNPQCAICLEQPMVRPVVLDKCHHAFCSCCLRNWSSLQSTTTSNCPLCRQEIPDMEESIIQDILMLLASAQKANASESFYAGTVFKSTGKDGTVEGNQRGGGGCSSCRIIPPTDFSIPDWHARSAEGLRYSTRGGAAIGNGIEARRPEWRRDRGASDAARLDAIESGSPL